MYSRPWAGSPLRMKVLKLSKVPRAATPMVARRPPFGASGLTHSNALKSGGYLSSPNADRPCLGPSAATPMEAPGAARVSKMASSAAGFGWSMKLALTVARMIAISRGSTALYGPFRPSMALYGRCGAASLAARLTEPLGGCLIVPPDPHERAAARRQLVRPAIHVPHGQTIVGKVPLWHDVVVPQQHAIERVRGGDELGPIMGKNDLADQRVDGGILNADHVSAALLVGGRRPPKLALLVAWRFRLGERGDDDVKIEGVVAALILGSVHNAHAGLDTELFQSRLEGQHNALEVRLDEEELGGQLRALRVGEHAVLGYPSRFCKHLGSLAQMSARVLGSGVDGIAPNRGEHLRRHLVLDLLQQLELSALGSQRCLELGVVEKALQTLVLIVEQVLVGPLEVERQIERAPHARILELRPANVEGERLHLADALGGHLVPFYQTARERIEVVGGGPKLGAVLVPVVELARLESLKRRHAIAEIGVADFVQIPLSGGDGQVLGPPVLDALVGDAAPGVHVLDAVGTGAQWDFERRLGKIARFPICPRNPIEVLGKHHQIADDEGKLAIALDVENERDLTVPGLLGPRHVLVIKRIVGRDFLERLEREDHILGGDGPAVVKARARPQLKGGGGEIGGVGHPLRDQPIGCRRFVRALHHERVVDEPQTVRRAALDGERMERIEASKRPLPHPPALGGGRIDPVEVLEVGPVTGTADQGQGVVLGEVLGGQYAGPPEDKRAHEGGWEPATAGHQVYTLQACAAARRAWRTERHDYAGPRRKRQVNPCSLPAWKCLLYSPWLSLSLVASLAAP